MDLMQLQRDRWSAPFFDAAANGLLLLLQCNQCHEWSAPQGRRCAYCSSEDVSWAESTASAEVVTWAVPHRRANGGTVPAYTVALVELAEGPWMYVQADPHVSLRAGQKVSVVFTAVDGGEHLPVLRSEPHDLHQS